MHWTNSADMTAKILDIETSTTEPIRAFVRYVTNARRLLSAFSFVRPTIEVAQ